MKILKNNSAYILTIFFIGFLYAFAKFPGVDSHSGYFGFTIKIIYPDSLPGDSIGNHLAMISLHSVLVKTFGDLWLDDRFVLTIYFFLVIASLLGIDRLAVLFGVTNKLGRLAVMSILMFEHMFVDNVAHIVGTHTFRPSNYAQPLGIWLAYFLLKDPKAIRTISLSWILLLTTVKNGWFPFFTTGLFTLKEVFHTKWTRIAAVMIFASILVFSGHYFWSLSQDTILQNVFLFDNAILNIENSETNPFQDGLGPLLYISFILFASFVKFPDEKIEARIRALFFISILVYLIGGIYYTFAPDPVKIPLLVPLGISRSTWWTQIIGFLYLSCWVIRLFDNASPKKKIFLASMLFLLYVFPIFNYISYRTFFLNYYIINPVIYSMCGFILVLVVLSVVCYHHSNIIIFGMILRNNTFLRIAVFLPIILFTICFLSYNSYKRLPQLSFLFNHGILGKTASAKWIGVSDFFRYETDINSRVIAFSGNDKKLIHDTSFKVRSGRTMLDAHLISAYLNYEAHSLLHKNKKLIAELTRSINACDMINLKKIITLLGGADYIVLPKNNLCSFKLIEYKFVKNINSYKIFQKNG